MPANNNILSQSRTSPYNYERAGTVSPTIGSVLHISSPLNSTGSQHHHHQHHTQLQQHHHQQQHKMNGNVSSRGVNFSRYQNSGVSPLQVSPIMGTNTNVNISTASKQPLLDISRTNLQTSPQLNASRNTHNVSKVSALPENSNRTESDAIIGEHGIHEMLASLALMCLLSLLMAFLALFFLQRTCPVVALPEDSNSDNNQKVNTNVNAMNQMRIVSNTKEYVRIFQISVSLSTLTISLDLCCLFVCCIQFLSAVKLLKTPFGKKRTFEFLKKTSHIRVAAIGAFLISIPIFFTGVILFTFVNFDEIPALATSVIIGIGIIFCGIASVQNVYLWQWEKTKASQELSQSRISQLRDSGYLPTLELSTLV